jgi:hypothetical protein
MNAVDANAAQFILHTAGRIQQNYKMRREIDAYLGNPLQYVPEHVRDAFKESHGALTVAINDDLEKVVQCKLWKEEVLPILTAELGDLSPEKTVNLLRTLHLVVGKLGLAFPVVGPKTTKPPRMIDASYERLVFSCLSGNEYRTLEHIKTLIEGQEPLFEHARIRLHAVLTNLASTGKAKEKTLECCIQTEKEDRVCWIKARKRR